MCAVIGVINFQECRCTDLWLSTSLRHVGSQQMQASHGTLLALGLCDLCLCDDCTVWNDIDNTWLSNVDRHGVDMAALVGTIVCERIMSGPEW